MTQPATKPRILVVEDDPATADLLSHSAIKLGFLPLICRTSREAEAADWRGLSAVLLDLHLPDGDGFDLLCRARKHHSKLPCFVLTSRDSAESAVNALKAGASDYFIKPFEPAKLFSSIRETLAHPPSIPAIARTIKTEWKSDVMQELYESALRAARLSAPVLLVGEPGSGKRSLATFIHSHSRRSSLPFASIDVESLDEAALELDLFGGENHRSGGRPMRKRGKIEMTNGGTLFIQGIERLPQTLQSRLLESLEIRDEAGQGVAPDFRLIAASSSPLEDLVAAGVFRKDLYYRLSTKTLNIPALRDIPEDIILWSDRILTEICLSRGCRRPQLTRGSYETLADHAWPGNLDELRNTLEKALDSSKGGVIGVDDLRVALSGTASGRDVSSGQLLAFSSINELERASVIAALEACNGNRRRAAKRLGVSLRTIYNMIDRHSLRGVGKPADPS